MNIFYYYKQVIMALCLICLMVGNSFGQSLYESYTQKTNEELKTETQEMSQQIVRKFNQHSMDITQQKINFYEYFSNLKKLMLYGSKLSTYANYEENLKFAKEKELFKGLPEKEKQDDNGRRDQFLNEKYKMMHTNIKDEIGTYVDLIQSSLDSCEHLILYDLDEIGMSETNKESVLHYISTSKTANAYFQKRANLAKSWQELEMRISKQILVWQEKGHSPTDPIVDNTITEAIKNGGSL